MKAARTIVTDNKLPGKNDKYEKLAAVFSVLANPTRLRILEVLMTACTCSLPGKCCVSDIHKQLKLAQPIVSKHLKILKEMKILTYEREGNKIYYSFTLTAALSAGGPPAPTPPSGAAPEAAPADLLAEIYKYLLNCCGPG